MSEENVEIVRRLYESWMRGDFSSGVDAFDSEVEFVVDASVTPEPVTVRGVAAMGEAWRESLSQWGDFRVGKMERLVETADGAVVFNVLEGRGRRSGAVVDQPARAAVFTFRNGRIVRLQLTDRNTGLKAAGLSE